MLEKYVVVTQKAQDDTDGPVDSTYERALKRAIKFTKEDGVSHYICQVISSVNHPDEPVVVDHRKKGGKG